MIKGVFLLLLAAADLVIAVKVTADQDSGNFETIMLIVLVANVLVIGYAGIKSLRSHRNRPR